MKKLFFVLLFLVAWAVVFGQTTRSSTPGFVPSSNQTFVNEIGNVSARNGLFVPRYTDTAQANTYILKDTAGNVVYTYATQSLWLRINETSSNRKWVEVGSGGSGGATWGSITGTLSNQTDLQTALNLKANLASPTFTGTVTIPSPFTLGATSVLTSGAELNFVDGVTSNIQTQLDAKQATITFGTGVQTALGVNIGSAGAPILFNGAAGTPSSITLTNANGFPYATGGTGRLPFANLTQGSARSVLGVTGNATADFASIQGTANQVLVINSAGTALAFGQVNLSSSAAVTGTLPSSFTVAHGIDDVLAIGQSIDGVDRVMNAINNGEVSMIARETLVSPYGAEVNAISGVGTSRIILKVDNADGEFSLRMGVDGSFEIADDRTGTPALQYAADYAAGFTDRSIIDRGYYLNFEANRTVNLAGSSLQIQDGGVDYLLLNPATGAAEIKAFNNTDNGNQAQFHGEAESTQASFRVEADFNDGVKNASISGDVNATEAVIEYFADTHTFNGDILTATDNTYDIGDATNSFKDIYARTAIFDGSTSGSFTVFSEATGIAGRGITASGTGYIPAYMFASQTSTNSLSDINTVQAIFASGFDVFTLAASTSYFFEGMYIFDHGATSHSVGLSFELGGGASVTSIAYNTTCWVTASNTNTASQTTNMITQTTNTAVNAAGSNATERIYFSGIIRMNAGGTVTPSVTFSAAPGGAPTTGINSYIRFTPIGSNTINSLGNVN